MATSTEVAFVAGVHPAHAMNERRRLLENVFFGALDYLVQPLLMVLTARLFIRHMGIAKFGTWMLVLAIIGSMGVFCTGFGDAALKYVSTMRGRGDMEGVRITIRAARTLNLLLGAAAAVLFFIFSPWAATHVFHLAGRLAQEFIGALRIGGAVLLIRSMSFVSISTLRAFERYRVATQITACTRIAIIAAAVALAVRGFGLMQILFGTATCELASLVALTIAAREVTGALSIGFRLHAEQWRSLASFGVFSWMQALLGSIFSQADRMLVASMLGPAAVGYYGVCLQASQPIHGLAASGGNVLFPHVSARLETENSGALRHTLRRAIRINRAVALGLAFPLVFFSRPILTHWMGFDFAQHAWVSMALVAVSFAGLAFNIPGHYALMALGRVRFLTLLNLSGTALAFIVSLLLIPRFGIVGAALGRLAYGPVTWFVYPKLKALLAKREPSKQEA